MSAGEFDVEKHFDLLQTMFASAVAAADPMKRVPAFLPEGSQGKLTVVGAGKASARMAQAVETAWQGPLTGLVVTRYGHAEECRHIEIVEAAHPVPDKAGLEAARRILQIVADLGPDDHCLALISGGGSALLTAPVPGVSFAEKRAVNEALLASGASIGEMNCVRKHLSCIKGGRLSACAAPAAVTSLLISDVPGDDPAVIASGPTVADSTTLAEARDILERYKIAVPVSVQRVLRDNVHETPKPGDRRLASGVTHIIAAPQKSLEAAASEARAKGITPLILGDSLEGEAREMGRVMAGIARQVRRHGQPASTPCVLISGGETTVTVRGDGCSGRNGEFLLALVHALDGAEGIYAIAADTDGIDGMSDAAGAMAGPDSLRRAEARGLSALNYLERNDAHSFFAALNDQVITGPTLTNVNDFRAVLII